MGLLARKLHQLPALVARREKLELLCHFSTIAPYPATGVGLKLWYPRYYQYESNGIHSGVPRTPRSYILSRLKLNYFYEMKCTVIFGEI